jgi:hypothetical protein
VAKVTLKREQTPKVAEVKKSEVSGDKVLVKFLKFQKFRKWLLDL